jgi:hypothetical protein
MMADNEQKTPRLATSQDIPRAVEYLINAFVRGVCVVAAGSFGLLALLGVLLGWSWWAMLPVSLIAVLSLLFAIRIRPRGRMAFDSKGPIIVVPREEPRSG